MSMDSVKRAGDSMNIGVADATDGKIFGGEGLGYNPMAGAFRRMQNAKDGMNKKEGIKEVGMMSPSIVSDAAVVRDAFGRPVTRCPSQDGQKRPRNRSTARAPSRRARRGSPRRFG